jgi:Flp pilus assembly pilin Flp
MEASRAAADGPTLRRNRRSRMFVPTHVFKPLDESGQTMAEYGVILALITLAVVGSMTLLGSSIGNALSGVAAVLP